MPLFLLGDAAVRPPQKLSKTGTCRLQTLQVAKCDVPPTWWSWALLPAFVFRSARPTGMNQLGTGKFQTWTSLYKAQVNLQVQQVDSVDFMPTNFLWQYVWRNPAKQSIEQLGQMSLTLANRASNLTQNMTHWEISRLLQAKCLCRFSELLLFFNLPNQNAFT